MPALAVLLTAMSSGCDRRPLAATATTPLVSPAQRADALRRAHVWHSPTQPIAQAALARNPPGPGSFKETDEVDCTFVPRAVGGTTPKFYCAVADGETVKVKYGASNPELPAEVAATRLLHAIGFETDRMYVVRSVRCRGCPPFPFEALECVAHTAASACLRGASPDHVVIVRGAVIERAAAGRTIESAPGEGWAWYELDAVDAGRGGSSRAELDAFRLLAVLLAHWDNKAGNQRLICPPGSEGRDGACAAPLAMIHDLGATFGPLKLDLPNWRRTAVWSDRAGCRVSLKSMPFGGGTFPDREISEGGRQLLLRLLHQLSRDQLRDVFAAAGVARFEQVVAEGRDPDAWADAFIAKVREIERGGPCHTP